MNRLGSLFAGFALALAFAFSSSAFADDFKADPVHSFVVFDVHHLGAGYVYGTFGGPTGTITYDASDPTKTSFDMSVNTATIETRSENRDKDLKGPDYFDVKQFPQMTFKSTSVTKTGDQTLAVTGDLTVRGVTKSITVPMEITGTGNMMGHSRTGFRADFKIDRRDYGMVIHPEPMIGNNVHIIVAIEAVQQ